MPNTLQRRAGTPGEPVAAVLLHDVALVSRAIDEAARGFVQGGVDGPGAPVHVLVGVSDGIDWCRDLRGKRSLARQRPGRG